MIDLASRYYMGLNFLTQNYSSVISSFPRLPPGTMHPMANMFQRPLDAKFNKSTEMTNPQLADYQQWYKQQSASLFGMNSGIYPPGHPIFSRQTSIDTLQNENKKLQKENSELKKQLEKSSKQK